MGKCKDLPARGSLDSLQVVAQETPNGGVAKAGNHVPLPISIGSAADHQFRLDLEIPKQQMGIIIGPGGSVITEIKQLSQTDISIKDDREGLSSVVTIIGSDVARQTAQNLIFARLREKLPHLFGAYPSYQVPAGGHVVGASSWTCLRCKYI